MDIKTINILECARIRETVAGFAKTESSKNILMNLDILDSVEKITEAQNFVKEQKALYDADKQIPIGGLVSLEAILEKISPENTMLEPEELLKIARFLTSVRLCKKFILDNQRIIPLHAGLFDDLKPLPEIEKEIKSKIDENAKISDDASDELKSIRKNIRKAEANVAAKVQQILSSFGDKNVLQDNYYTQRNGRYVIPVRASAKNKVPGIIHDASSSGETFFIEPLALIEPSNEVQNLHLQEKEEIRKILVNLTKIVRIDRIYLNFNNSLMTKLDLIHAKTLFMAGYNLHLPLVLNNEPLKMLSFHHPFIYLFRKNESVPIDLRIRQSDKIVLITGPNTGGKTTALKSVGLNSWMALCGLAIPASPDSVIPYYRNIFVDIGDEQDITEGVSTFSSHIRNLNRIMENVAGDDLVLLDELGTATDPQEGGALACAVLEKLNKHASLIIATSHLPILKQWAHTFPCARNASFYLDENTHSPNFKIVMDIPGSSEALIIAEREGIPHKVIERAKTFLTSEEKDLSELLLSIQEKDKELGFLRQQTTAIKEANEALKLRYEKLVSEIEQKQKVVKKQMIDEKEEVLKNFKKELEAKIAALPSRKELSKVRDNIIQEQKKIHTQKKQIEKETARANGAAPLTNTIKEGDKVFVTLLQDVGTLASINFEKNRAVVIFKNKEMILPIDTLSLPDAKDLQAEKARAEDAQYQSVSWQRKGSVREEINLHGMRVEPALSDIDKHLSDAALSGLPHVRICHGHGTGILRKAVHEFLKFHPLVKKYYYAGTNEGGSGVTIAELK